MQFYRFTSVPDLVGEVERKFIFTWLFVCWSVDPRVGFAAPKHQRNETRDPPPALGGEKKTCLHQ